MNDIIKGMGFHHIALHASDFDRSLEFYKALGLKEYVGWGEGDNRALMLDFGDGGYIELFAGSKTENPVDNRYLHLALKADDVDTAFDTAIKAGATVKDAPCVVKIEGATRPLTLHVAFVYGPDGELLEFFKEV